MTNPFKQTISEPILIKKFILSLKSYVLSNLTASFLLSRKKFRGHFKTYRYTTLPLTVCIIVNRDLPPPPPTFDKHARAHVKVTLEEDLVSCFIFCIICWNQGSGNSQLFSPTIQKLSILKSNVYGLHFPELQIHVPVLDKQYNEKQLDELTWPVFVLLRHVVHNVIS